MKKMRTNPSLHNDASIPNFEKSLPMQFPSYMGLEMNQADVA
jgi:hypothetical protein